MKTMKEAKMSKSDQAAFAKYFSQKGILYQPGFALVFDSVNAGILLGQLLYWHGKGYKKPWTYKTAKELERETGLSRTKQDNAIKILVSFGILSVQLRGVPATRHFKLDLKQLHKVLSRLQETGKLDYPNPANYKVQNRQTITETTRKTTSKTGFASPAETDETSDYFGIILGGNVDNERQ